jgi:hypothetical protein
MRRGGNKVRTQAADKRRLADAHPWRRSKPENRVPPTPPDQVLAQADAKRVRS